MSQSVGQWGIRHEDGWKWTTLAIMLLPRVIIAPEIEALLSIIVAAVLQSITRSGMEAIELMKLNNKKLSVGLFQC